MMFKWLHKENEEEKELFGDIVGYENVKKILYSMMRAKEPVSILLDGSAGTGKSMMLRDIQRAFPKESRYLDGSRTTKAGIFALLKGEEDNHREIRYLLLDEVDKLDYPDQEALLTLIEEGKIIQTQKNGIFTRYYPNLRVIAASNNKDALYEPLLTRFYKIKIKDYTKEQFREIARKALEKYNLDRNIVYSIIELVLETKEKPNIRDCKHIANLCNNDINMVKILIENSFD